MKIFVAIPTYDGKLHVEVARSLMSEQAIAIAKGCEFDVRFLPGCSHPAMGRNQLVKDFLDSGFDKLFFLDSDVTWTPGEITLLCHFPREFVGGCYRYKNKAESYPIGWTQAQLSDGKFWFDKMGLIEVNNLPGGFCAIDRSAFERVMKAYPEREYEHFGKKSFAFYEMRYDAGRLWGEDAHFCKLFREAGGKVYLRPDMTLKHWDFAPVPFEGNVHKWLGEVTFANQPLKFHEPVLECGMTDEELKEQGL